MGRNNQNSKWAGHQQLDPRRVFVENSPLAQLNTEPVVNVPTIEEVPVEAEIAVPVVTLEINELLSEEVPVEIAEVPKIELKPIVKKTSEPKNKNV